LLDRQLASYGVDLDQDRPQGMWTHHPAVALLAEEHARTLD
jgi:hypothetical protein